MSTQRTKATLEALFPDNVTRQISPDRLRDFAESCTPSYGTILLDDPGVATPIAAASTWTKAANTTTLQAGAYRFSQAADNRLAYDGVTSVIAHASAMLAVVAAASGKTFSFALAINGAIEEASRCTVTITTAGETQLIAISIHAVLAPADYLELYVRNETDDTDLTITHGHFTAFAFMI